MKIGKALNTGKPSETISVEVDGQVFQKKAGNEINSGKVLVTGDTVLSESSPYKRRSRTNISRRRKKKQNIPVTYPIKLLGLVDNEAEEKWEVWLYGDRERPIKIYEIDKQVDEENEFGAVTLESIVLDNNGKKKADWEAFVKALDVSQNIDLPPEIVALLPGGSDISTSYNQFYANLIRKDNTVLYDGNYAQNLEYKGGYAIIRNDLLIDTASEPRDYNSEQLDISEEETILYEWDFSGLTEQNDIILFLYLDKGLTGQTGETYIPLDEIGTAEFIFPSNYIFPPFDSILEINNFSSSGSFRDAVESSTLTDFRIDRYIGGGNIDFFGTIVAGGFDLSALSEGVRDHVSDIYPKPSFIVNTDKEEYIYTDPTLPYFVHVNNCNFGLSANGRLGLSSVTYGFSLNLETNDLETIEQIGIVNFSYDQGFVVDYLPLENRTYNVSYSSQNPFQPGTPSANRFESLFYLNGVGSYSFEDNFLNFSLQKISTFIAATFQTYQFIDSTIPSLHLYGQNSFIVSEYIIQKNDSLQETQRLYRYYLYLLEENDWTTTEITDYSLLEEDGKLDTPKEYFTLKGNKLYKVIDDDETLTKTLTKETELEVTTYEINEGIIEEKGTKKIAVLPLKKQASVKSACFF